MRRKEESQVQRKKQIQKQQYLECSLDTQMSLLLSYIKIMPKTFQLKLLIPLIQIQNKQQINDYNTATINKLKSSSSQNITSLQNILPLIQIFLRLLKLNKIKQSINQLSKKNYANDSHLQSSISKDHSYYSLQPFEPNYLKLHQKFDPIPTTINPNYQNIVKLYKTYTDVHINTQYKIKDQNQNYTFFAPPRLISKLLQIHDFETGFPQKGNIILINFQGSKIIGKRGLAFVNKNVIYWWQKNYKDFKDILPDLVEDRDKDKQTKQKDKKKQYDKEQNKNQNSDPPKSHLNFKLSYKMVGHHGKITTLSLSDDQYYLISAGTDKVIKLWCLRQKCLLTEYRGHLKTIWSVSFSKCGYFFLSGSADATIKLWSTDDSIAQRIFIGHDKDVIKVDFLKNPDLMASSSSDQTVRIWNTLTTQCLNIFQFDHQVTNFKSSLSGRYFITSDEIGKITLFDLLKGQSISSFIIPQKQINKLSKYLKIHDMSISMDQKQFTCVSSKYIVIYSFDKICQKQSKNIFSQTGRQSKQRTIATKEVIYTGQDSNLVYCEYVDKGLLLVASTSTKKY